MGLKQKCALAAAEQVRFFIFLRIIISVTKTNCYSNYVGTCTEFLHSAQMPNETEVHIFREVSKWIDCAVYFNIEGRKRWRERERKEQKMGENCSTRKRIENGNCCTTLNTRDLGQPEGKKNLCRTRKWMCPRLKYIQQRIKKYVRTPLLASPLKLKWNEQ